MNGYEYGGSLLTVFIFVFANAGGLAGGGISLPIIMVFFGFDFKKAVALSNITIFISSLMRYLINSKLTHPLKTTPDGKPTGVLVDYSISIIMLPLIICGVALGTTLYIVLPTICILVVLIILLIGLVVLNACKIRKMCKAGPANDKVDTDLDLKLLSEKEDTFNPSINQDKTFDEPITSEAYKA
jgi:uncharacterized membrane protein YfcA